MSRCVFLFLVASAVLAGCESSRNNTSWSGADKGADVVPALQSEAAVPAESTVVDSLKINH